MAQTKRKKTGSKKRKKKNGQDAAVVLLVFLGALMLGLFLLIRVFFGAQPAQPEETSVPETAPAVTEYLPPSTLTAEGFGREDGFITYTQPGVSTATGIDVSSHQEWIDWQAVAESGIDYAIIRVGYRGYSDGDLNQDDYFQYNIDSAVEAGLDIGVYFFSQALTEKEAVEEAEMVLELVEDYDLSYPIYYDWEPIDNAEARTDTVSSSEVTACANAFCQRVEQAGYEAGVYFNLSNAVHLFRLYELKEYDFWLAEYQDTPSYPFEIDMWQYTESGSVPGIDTEVDVNLRFIRE